MFARGFKDLADRRPVVDYLDHQKFIKTIASKRYICIQIFLEFFTTTFVFTAAFETFIGYYCIPLSTQITGKPDYRHRLPA